MSWLLAAGAKGFPRYLWIAGIALVFLGVVLTAKHFVSTAFETTEDLSREAGAQGAVVAGQATTLDQIGDANEASTRIAAGRSLAKFNQCVRSSAEGFAGHCDRYKPDEPVSGGS